MLFDAYGRPIQAHVSNTCQDKEHAQSAAQSAEDKQSLPRIRAPIKVIVESSDTDSKQHKSEYRYSYALQRQAVQVQWYLLIATMAAFGAAAYYAWIAKQQLATMNETLKEAHVQNIAQQRAALEFEIVPAFKRLNGLGILIHNNGRMPAKLLSYNVEYKQHVSYGGSFTRNRTVDLSNSDAIIGGGYDRSLEISIPPLPKYIPGRGGEWSVTVRLVVRYDNGFGDEVGLRGCYSLDLQSGKWDQTCGWYTSIDLSGDGNRPQKDQ